ncbi:MAG: methyltransferase [Kofleriaceae bacterium]|nr:methyltransferase [Kofleriaceae bacterium]
MARAADFDLAKALAQPNFTPGQRDAPALVELVVTGDEPAATRAAPALARLGEGARVALLRRLAPDARPADDGASARLIAAVGLLARAGDREARAHLVTTTRDAAPRVRRAAIVALGKLGAQAPAGTERSAGDLDDVRTALLARWDADDATPDERRALAEALGKIGGDAALARLGALDAGADKELARRRDRAVLMMNRSAQRDEDSTIAADVVPPQSLMVRLRCRPGLAELLHAELRVLGLASAGRRSTPRLLADDDAPSRHDYVDVLLDGPWQVLFASRLWASASMRVPLVGMPRGDLAGAIVATLTTGVVPVLFTRWTRGPIRWRLGMREGTRRSLIWRVAKDVAAKAPQLINDPTQTTWDIVVDEREGILEIMPRRIVDPRFAYRVAEVPAASHPSIAAALVWLAEQRATDRVWDPFCGSGLELIERARRGPAALLLGTDIDDDALAAARANLTAAGVVAKLERADARTHAPGPIDLIITNPPLGSRVQLDAAALLAAALPGFARQLAPGGHLVWISPAPAKTSPVAEAQGLYLARSFWVDLGGVRGRLERWDRRAAAR